MGLFKKTPEEKAAKELRKIQNQIEKRLKERIKFVEAVDDWVAVTACDRYRTPPAPNMFTIRFFMKMVPHLANSLADSKVMYVPPELEGKKIIPTELTQEEIQTLVKEGFRCIVAGIWNKEMPGGIWGKKCTDKKEAKEEAKRIKKLLGW